jgi:methionyl-tRNA formyltransferase
VYFNKLFPMGVSAMLEAADLVHAGKHTETVQDEAQATYEGWCRGAEARIDWAKPVDQVYNLIRGCNPAPGAWTTIGGKKLYLYDARKTVFRRFGDVVGKIGEITAIGEGSIRITAQGGQIEALRVRHEDGKKTDAADFARSAGVTAGTFLGT